MNYKEQTIRANFKFFGGISILYGLLFAFCMYRNLFGATFLVYAIATVYVLVLFIRKVDLKIKKETKIYYMLIIICGMSTCITSNKPLQFLNWCCVIGLLIVSMLGQFFNKSNWDIPSYLVNSVILFVTTIGYSFLPIKETGNFIKKEEHRDNKKVSFIIIGVLVALGSLLIILPLLISSDMIFRKVFESLTGWLSFAKIVPSIQTALGIFITALLGFVLIYGFFYASCRVDFSGERQRIVERCHPIIGISFSAVIGAIYLLYSAIQIVYLFFGNAGSLPEGITYSQYAREGFWQLVAVAALNIIIVMLCMYLFEENKYLKVLLTVISGCTFIMMASAAYRMYLYVSIYHLTFLRLLVFWFLLILALIMGGVIVSIYKKGFQLVRYIILTSVCGYLIFSMARPDYQIAKYNMEHIQDMRAEDLSYMMHGLSLDAAPVIAEKAYDYLSGDDNYNMKGQLYDYFRTISNNNQEIYFRKANYSRIKAKTAADIYIEEHAEDSIYSAYYYGDYEYQ